jgi:cell division protein FtsX
VRNKLSSKEEVMAEEVMEKEEKRQLPKLEKKLEKMTIKELREIALQIPEITGVHGMNKEELIAVLKEVYGIKEEKRRETASMRELKAKVKKFKALAEEAKKNRDWEKYERYRRLASKFKKRTRKLAKMYQ